MNVLFIIFFASLIGITLMIGKKLVLVRELSASIDEEKIPIEIPRIRELKDVTLKKIKKYGFVIIVITIRFYVKSLNFFKKQTTIIVYKINSKFNKKNVVNDISEKQEASKFLKMVSEYKQKIGRIKRKIKEEERVE
mgnify:FL=1